MLLSLYPAGKHHSYHMPFGVTFLLMQRFHATHLSLRPPAVSSGVSFTPHTSESVEACLRSESPLDAGRPAGFTAHRARVRPEPPHRQGDGRQDRNETGRIGVGTTDGDRGATAPSTALHGYSSLINWMSVISIIINKM